MKNRILFGVIFLILFKVAALALTFIFVACNKERTNTGEDTKKSANIVVNFKYNGQKYSYSYNTSTLQVTGEEHVIQLIDVLKANESLATLVFNDESIEYFDSYEHLLESLKKNGNSASSPISYPDNFYAKLTLWEHDEYKGASMVHDYQRTTSAPVRRPDLGIAWNDNISSMEMSLYGAHNGYSVCFIFSCWEQKNYSGQSLTYIVDWKEIVATTRRYTEFRNIHNQPWNDRIRSFQFYSIEI